MRILFSFLLGLICILAFGCSSETTEGQAIVAELRGNLDDRDQEIAKLKQDNAELNSREKELLAQLATHEGEAGIDHQRRQEVLEEREASLKSLEGRLIERETAIEQQEERIAREHQQFYERTNMTMQEIGEAKKIKEEYEIMRSEKDAAIALSQDWIARFWWALIAFVVLLVAAALMLARMWNRARLENEERRHRKDLALIIQSSMLGGLSPDQSRPLIEAVHRVAGIESASPARTSN